MNETIYQERKQHEQKEGKTAERQKDCIYIYILIIYIYIQLILTEVRGEAKVQKQLYRGYSASIEWENSEWDTE